MLELRTYLERAWFVEAESVEHIFIQGDVGPRQTVVEHTGRGETALLAGAIDTCIPESVHVATACLPHQLDVFQGFYDADVGQTETSRSTPAEQLQIKM